MESGHPAERRALFEAVYRQDVWHHADGSGHGSTVEYTVGLRRALGELVTSLGIESLIDAGCGAGVWQQSFLAAHKTIAVESKRLNRYHGVDASATAVARATARLAPLGATLATGDVCIDQLPRGFDAVLCRDCLQHLTLEEVAAALKTMTMCGARWYIIGGYYPGKNVRVGRAYHFDVNLAQAPFELTPEFVVGEDNPADEPQKFLFVYSGEKLRATDWAALATRVAAFF